MMTLINEFEDVVGNPQRADRFVFILIFYSFHQNVNVNIKLFTQYDNGGTTMTGKTD